MFGLIVPEDVVLNDITRPVVSSLSAIFVQFDKSAVVTSGVRTPESQLRIIQHYAHLNELEKDFPDILTADLLKMITWNNEQVFSWQPAWSKLLQLGVIVNPPRPAKTLFEYKGKVGEMIDTSPHIKGVAFDIGGHTADEILVVHYAYSKGIPGFKEYLVEPRNNAIHCQCEKV